jgi:hypothetical protein
MVPDGPSCGTSAELSTTVAMAEPAGDGLLLVAGVSAALVWMLPDAAPVELPALVASEAEPAAVEDAWAVCVPVMAAKKSLKMLARAIEGRRVVTTKSIEISETTADATFDFLYFLPFGRESKEDCCFLPKISLFIDFYAIATGKEGNSPCSYFCETYSQFLCDERWVGRKLWLKCLLFRKRCLAGEQVCRR